MIESMKISRDESKIVFSINGVEKFRLCEDEEGLECEGAVNAFDIIADTLGIKVDHS